MAILSLVDGPRDLRFEFTARAVARELTAASRVVEGAEQIKLFMTEEKAQDFMRPKTKQYFDKVLKYHPERTEEFFNLVADWQVSLVRRGRDIGHGRGVATTDSCSLDLPPLGLSLCRAPTSSRSLHIRS